MILKSENILFDVVENITGFSKEQLISKSRKGELVMARHICFYVLKKRTSYSLSRIGHAIGLRDHSTVLHGLGKINESWLPFEKQYKTELALLQAILAEYDWCIQVSESDTFTVDGLPVNKEVISLMSLEINLATITTIAI